MSEAPAKPLKATLNLPITAFPMKADLPRNEPARLKSWLDQDLYGQIRAARAGAPKYILHDGPPYANGAIHLGHALNKCIKDFVVKTKTMAGFDAPYIPGWDCHGLPIEIKVDEKLGRKKLDMPAISVRRACREYAAKYVDLQRSQFQRLGVFGRWQDPYLTMSPAYEADILETFYGFFEAGFVYKGLKPVFWCIHDQTALAEAEVEYEQHTSPSVYIRYKLTSDPALIHPALAGRTVYTIIWTTTPWTIPASQAVAFNPDLEYVALEATLSLASSFASASASLKGTASAVPTDPSTDAASAAEVQSSSASPTHPTDNPVYIIAAALREEVEKHCNLTTAPEPIARFNGTRMDLTTFQHPFLDREILGVLAPYVTADQGTGAVHTSPAHGVDDFYTGKRYNLPDLQYVDNAGRQQNTPPQPDGTPQPFAGLTVFESNKPITDLLREHGALLSATHFEHSYPHCWRCHNPVIVRATEQWFISMEHPMEPAPEPSEERSSRPEQQTVPPSVAERRDPRISFVPATDPGAPHLASEMWVSGHPTQTFRQRALDAIKQVTWDPAWGEERISNMIATRPDWCISRQRIWGVPIAVFLCNRCHEPLNSPAINESIVALFRKESADAWYTHAAADLLPPGTTCPNCGNTDSTDPTQQRSSRPEQQTASPSVAERRDPRISSEVPPSPAFRKEMDILDVWFESGASWHAVLEADPTQTFPADLYTEGGDQHRGWFHSGLLTSVALRGEAPYRKVATSGWTLDEQGRAFSKSLGNGVDPVDVADRLGAEIIRLWVASVDFREDVAASESLMQRVGDNYRKLRNTLRFLLGNLHDFTPAQHSIAFPAMEPLDQYILARTAQLDAKIRKAYDDFEFHRAYHALNEFVNTDLSALYLDVLKDRLYTFAPNAPARRSAQTALWRIAEALTRLIAPILSFTADEVWHLLPQVEGREPNVHLTLFPDLADIVPGNESALEADWEQLLNARNIVLVQLEQKRTQKEIGKSAEASINIGRFDGATDAMFTALERYRMALPELFGVSDVTFSEFMRVTHPMLEGTGMVITAWRAHGSKCERCWRYVPDVAADPHYPTVCLRCAEALQAIHYPPYTAEPAA